jgi:hypothetical protein
MDLIEYKLTPNKRRIRTQLAFILGIIIGAALSTVYWLG